MEYVVAALYKFVTLENHGALRSPLIGQMNRYGVSGTLLLAREGINGTVAGTREGIDALRAYLDSDARFTGLSWKESFADTMPFYRAKVKLKKEIVTMGVEDIDPLRIVGTYVKPTEWNTLIGDPDTIVVDTRNKYEVGIGTFKNAMDPDTDSFREFPAFVKENLPQGTDRNIAMFCTGGIRCEKATALLKEQGFKNVYHLEGGILKYLEEIPEAESLWEGECFVFDRRVSVAHELKEGSYDQCHACRRPISDEDKNTDAYIPGVSCPNCFEQTTSEQRERFMERQKQIALARGRGDKHIGVDLGNQGKVGN